MIDTVNTQSAHYSDGCWTTGTGEHVIVILGSCRVLPYVNYFNRLNDDNKYTICLINLVNFMEREIPYKEKPILLDMIKRCKWFIREYAENFGFLNTSRITDENIYQLGMSPEIEISVPNWNDHLILENDWIDYGSPTPENYTKCGELEIERFYAICKLTSFPEFADVFKDSWRTTRFFWRPNHVSAKFTLWMFKLMDSKFLHMGLTDTFWTAAVMEDLYQFPNTQVTDRDRTGYGITW